MKQLMVNYFNNSLPNLVSFFVKDNDLNTKDLDEIMKLIIRGTTLDMLEGIENRLERLGLSADTVFAPYAELFPRVPAPPAAP